MPPEVTCQTPFISMTISSCFPLPHWSRYGRHVVPLSAHYLRKDTRNAGNVRPAWGFTSAGIQCKIAERKPGEMHEQSCDPSLDAGNVLDGGDRRSAVHEGLCGRQRHSLSAGLEHEGQEEGRQELQHRGSEVPRRLSYRLYDDL